MDKPIYLDNIPFDDVKTFEFLSKGENLEGVFQLSSFTTIKYMKKILPKLVEQLKDGKLTGVDVINILSDITTIIRPSSRNSGSTDRYIDKINGKKVSLPISVKNPFYKMFCNNTADTQNELIYQEQLMFLLNDLFKLDNLGISDIYRRYFENANEEKMLELKTIFWKIYKDKITAGEAKEFWNFLLTVAGYSFNRSHAVSYTVVSYITAYLKVHIGKYYISSCLARCTDDAKQKRSEKIESLVSDANAMGITVKLPKINNCYSTPTPDINEETIFLSPDIVKGLGNKISNVLASNNNFKTLDDFLLWSFNHKTIKENEDGEIRQTSSFNKAIYKILVQIGFFEPFEKDIKKLVDYINNFNVVVVEPREKKFLKGSNSYTYNCKKNANFREEIMPERDYEKTCYVKVFHPLLKEKIDIDINGIDSIQKSMLLWERELLGFLITSPFGESQNDKNLNYTRGSYGGSLVYVKNTSIGKTKNKFGEGSYEWVRVLGKAVNNNVPNQFYLPNTRTQYREGSVIFITFQITPSFKVLSHELMFKAI